METLNQWIENQLQDRNWRPADLARIAGIKDATLSRILNQTRQAGPEVCRAIAKALDADEEDVFRRAGLLSPLPPAVAEEREAMRILRQLPPEFRAVAINLLRALQPNAAVLHPPLGRSLAEAAATYQATQPGSLDQEINALLIDYPELKNIIEEARIQLSEQALYALILNIQTFTSSRERQQFSQLHHRLSHLLTELAS